MNEQEIIDSLLRKEEAGMAELLTHYGPLMRYIIAPIVPNPQDQEDCLSETAMLVWKKIEKFDPRRGSWNAWLTAVTRNYALNYMRKLSACPATEAIPPDAPSPEPDPEAQAIRKERQKALDLALGRLSPGDKALFYRKYYYMQPTGLIASEMGMTVRAVEGKLYRIKKQLRKMLGGDGNGQP